MAWDKNRPYFPLEDNGEIDDYDWGFPPSAKDIETMYHDGRAQVRSRHGNKKTFIPFKEVRLKLYIDHFMQRRAAGTLWWRDEEGRKYPMFMAEFNRILEENELLQIPIDGVWSAQKRGSNYGIQLIKRVDAEHSRRACQEAAD